MMEAVRTSETSVYVNETTRHYIPQDCHLSIDVGSEDGRTLGLCAVKGFGINRVSPSGFSATDLDGRVVGWFISFMVTRLLREAPKNSEGN
jgi:hypothetical protein